MTSPPADRAEGPEGRTYRGPDGARWPSFTTLTGLVPGKAQALAAWRARVGPAAADARLAESIDRGNRIHQALELGTPDAPPAVTAWLARHVALIYGRELVLADSQLRAAGTADLVALFDDGVVTVVDYKTGSRRPEHALQMAGYAGCDLVLGADDRWEPWELAGQVARALVLYIDRDGDVSVQEARLNDATYAVLAGLRAAWEWNRSARGALKAWKGQTNG